MSELVERVRKAGAQDAWNKPMVTESEARAIIEEVADVLENDCPHEIFGPEVAEWLRAQAQEGRDGDSG